MKKIVTAGLLACIATSAQAESRSFSATFSGLVGNDTDVRTIDMPRPIVAIADTKLSGATGSGMCQGKGTKTLVIKFSATGMVRAQYSATVTCLVVFD